MMINTEIATSSGTRAGGDSSRPESIIGGLVAFLFRRLLHGVVVLVAVAAVAYGLIRVLRPEEYPGESLLGGLLGDLDRALLHFDFGGACSFSGCPSIRSLWWEGMAPDLWLLGGAFAIGIVVGVSGGIWCATRPRSLASRLVEAAAMVALCAPVYVVGLSLLLLFTPTFGLVQLPLFFEPHTYQPLSSNPWDWFRSLLFPWLILSAPLAAACLRLTLAIVVENLHEHHVRTGWAKGLTRKAVVRRHAAPSAYAGIASLAGVTVPALVTNLVLVEVVFSVPGFFRHTRRALGQSVGYGGGPDVPMLQAVALWGAVLIVLMSIVSDVALARLDPRVRAGGRAPG